jgi:fumarate reductase (CoM/CoB) subunit A
MLARLIAMEIQAGRGSEHGGVYLDLTGLPEAKIKNDHALYYQRFRDAGLDLTKDVVEVAPAAHSIMGGVRIDSSCRTGVPGLFAAGEVTGGVHGANRLGGNAGTEIHVFGALAGENAARYAAEVSGSVQVEKVANAANAVLTSWQGNILAETGTELAELKKKIRRLMATSMGPVREKRTLSAALAQFDSLSGMIPAIGSVSPRELSDWFEVRNLLLISKLVCRAALLREESRGVHYRADFPGRDDAAWKKQIGFIKANGVTFHRL